MAPGRRAESRTQTAARVPQPRTPGTDASGAPDQLDALRHGDQAAFAELVRRLHPSMVRLA